MPSNAYTSHLTPLLADAEHLDDAHRQLPPGVSGRSALNRAAVVASVSAWEAYIEELVRESLTVLRPPAPPLGLWPALNATIRGQLGRFHNPNLDNVRTLLGDALGLQDIQDSWFWQNCTSAQAAERLAAVMGLRHRIAHGVNPRPVVNHSYSSRLPDFFRRLGVVPTAPSASISRTSLVSPTPGRREKLLSPHRDRTSLRKIVSSSYSAAPCASRAARRSSGSTGSRSAAKSSSSCSSVAGAEKHAATAGCSRV
jgi:hypothetical protein